MMKVVTQSHLGPTWYHTESLEFSSDQKIGLKVEILPPSFTAHWNIGILLHKQVTGSSQEVPMKQRS